LEAIDKEPESASPNALRFEERVVMALLRRQLS